MIHYDTLMYTCSKDQRSICCDESHSTCPTKTTVGYHKPQCAIGDGTLCQCVLSMIIHTVALHRNALKC